jgi:molecular chaperone GrpE
MKSKQTKKILEDKEQELGEHIEHLQRLQAEFENFQKRVEKERQNISEFANAKLIGQILPILDSFDNALEEKMEKPVKDGFEMIHKELKNILTKEGLEQIKAKDKSLDPYQHEVIDIKQGNKDDHVLDELQKGYTLKGKVLRATKVRISKKDVEKIKSKEDKKNE